MAGTPGNINPKGGGKLWLHEVTLSGSVWTLAPTPVAYSTGADLGFVKSSKFATNPTDTKLKDEAGIVVYTSTENEPTTEAVLYERSLELLNFLEFTTVGKFYLQYHYQGIVSAFHQEEFAIGQVVSQANEDFPDSTVLAYKFNKLVMEANQSFPATATLPVAGIDQIQTAYATPLHPYSTGAITLDAGKYLKRFKTAV